jgi:hypothetical protein
MQVCHRVDCNTSHFLCENLAAKDELRRNVLHQAELLSRVLLIPGTLPFVVTTNAIMKYNSIACKVLTELVLAPTHRH